jgi:hypothetical protein
MRGGREVVQAAKLPASQLCARWSVRFGSRSARAQANLADWDPASAVSYELVSYS